MDYTFKKLQRIENAPIDRRELVGLKLAIAIPALNAGITKQYDLDSSELSALRNFPSANQLVITNTSTKILFVRLGMSDKSLYTIPGNTIYTISNVDYNSFDIKNTHATDATTATEVIVHVIYEHAPKVAVIGGAR